MSLSRREFLDLLDKEGIAYFDYSTGELEDEFKAVRKLKPIEEQRLNTFPQSKGWGEALC